MGLDIQFYPGHSLYSGITRRDGPLTSDIMASDSESSHTGTQSQGLSPMPGMGDSLPPSRHLKISTTGLFVSPSSKRKVSVKPEMPGVMKRAQSTPNVRDLVHLDPSGLSSAEKKRNKLGYHRTAVACVHCRRRKIRCIIALDDPTSRCHNCIRLKKDCQFHPVDQQPPTSKRQNSTSRADESINDSSTPETSPATAGPHWDRSEAYSSGQFQSSAPTADGTGSFSFNGPVLHSEPLGSTTGAYAPNIYSQAPWSSTHVLTSPLHSIESGQYDATHPVQWSQRAPPGFDFSSYPSSAVVTPLHSATQEHFPTFQGSHVGEPLVMQQMNYQPVRSMSLANPHELQNYHSPYFNDSQYFLQRQSTNNSDIHPPSLSSNTNPTPPGSDTHSTSSAYAYGEHMPMNASFHSTAPLQSPSLAVSGSEGFNQGYYGAPMGLADVKEEDEITNVHHHNHQQQQHHHHHQMTNRFRHNHS